MSPAKREGFTVRVLRTGGTGPAGVGIVVSDRHIVTCAHVVNGAIGGRVQRAQERPGPEVRIQVDFPLLGDAEGGPLRSCRIEAWTPPPSSGFSGGDVAGLVLVGEGLPEGAGPARLIDPANHRDAALKVFGYPGDPPRRSNGAWSPLQLRGAVGGGFLQLDADSQSAIRAQPGYSGSPAVVIDEAGDAVLGMLAVASRDEDTRDAYAIPVSLLVNTWPEVLGDLTIPACPYRGLLAFTADDAEAGLFVGREDEIQRLREMVDKSALVVVAGPSGVGKSSVVTAGLIPALRRAGWVTASFRPGRRPFDAMARALLDVEQPGQMPTIRDLTDRASKLQYKGLARLGSQLRLLRDKPILLHADQLEEVLDPGTCTPKVKEQFLELILSMQAAHADQLRLVSTLRADFLPQLLEHPDAGARLQDRLFALSPMGRERLERVISSRPGRGACATRRGWSR